MCVNRYNHNTILPIFGKFNENITKHAIVELLFYYRLTKYSVFVMIYYDFGKYWYL